MLSSKKKAKKSKEKKSEQKLQQKRNGKISQTEKFHIEKIQYICYTGRNMTA
jgi:hypothetical protein